MSLGRLPEHEQHILDEIERSLRRDRRLNRLLRGRQARRSGPKRFAARVARCDPRGRTVALLTLAAVALMVTGLVTSAPWAIWTFAVVWPVVVFLGFRLLSRWSGDGGAPDGR
ncbi:MULTISPECIES: DUF3040 domain-containing protein [Actinomycetes]|uniref:DUF3040 domain-containing protein n=1 Tax=Streptomyces griseorubens TaxID=66897 RepID=A0ABR4SVC0_9ACTN|nr:MULTISPECIES: DUF3040 domain-containing protein [Actinomycetes]ALV52935.1 hypothetical protein ASR50_28300 [Streptomyces sp. 4F]MCC9689014.1 DUF3040 domain-containing protein [Streptomyces sp. MNU103]GGQ59998.1 hypothetical protein GCM10010250_35400 [Streptomyces althioticus]KEG39157.1 hypothetical protein DJ64_16850 [Streptomyces griseorubens]MBM4827800.1 DUF3040 domain-containing protein [Actinospica acidiphila]